MICGWNHGIIPRLCIYLWRMWYKVFITGHDRTMSLSAATWRVPSTESTLSL
jgi:hypothetical protein